MSIKVKARKVLRGAVLDVCGLFAKPAPGVHIITGHMLSPQGDTSRGREHYRNMLSELSKHCRFARFEDAVEMIDRHESPEECVVAFSFDDGFLECHTAIAPILEEFNVNAAFFVNPNFVEGDDAYIEYFTTQRMHQNTKGKRPMRWEQIEDLHRRGFVIGAHTMDHYMINSDDENELRYQIVECKRKIEKHLDSPCDYFAFPYGRLEQANDMSIRMAYENYKYVFSQSDYRHYYSYNGMVINRRHYEPFWPVGHVKYFIGKKRNY